MPISSRSAISQYASLTKNWATEQTMIAIRSTVNRTWRPNLSVSHPPTNAPRKMPIRAEAPTRPCSMPFRLSWG
jgi:hypothetical protein